MKRPRFNVVCRLTGATLYSSKAGRKAFFFAQRRVYGTHVVMDADIGTMRQRTPADVRVERNGATITPELKEVDLLRRFDTRNRKRNR